MNLLMLLSALISALTGVGASVRQPEMARAVAQVVVSDDVARTVVASETRRAAVTLPALRTIAAHEVVSVFALAPAVAIWTSRRRE